jgi:hypothetical protein
LSIPCLMDELAGKAYARIFTRAVIQSPGGSMSCKEIRLSADCLDVIAHAEIEAERWWAKINFRMQFW